MTPPPPVPSASGWSSGKALFPSSVVMTGICRSSASSSNSGEASAYITPWPAWITGLWASTSTRATRRPGGLHDLVLERDLVTHVRHGHVRGDLDHDRSGTPHLQ